MKRRDQTQTPWTLEHSQLFEQKFYRLVDRVDRNALIEAYGIFERIVCRDPRQAGEQHLSVEALWIYQTPPIMRLPNIVVSYTIDDEKGVVRAWSIDLLDPN